MSDTTPKPPCGTCKGTYEEHFDDKGNPVTHHAYTEQEGEMVTHQQKAKQQAQMAGRLVQPSAMQGALMTMGANPMSMGRLVEVLIEKGMVSSEEGLYIAGYGPKPEKQAMFRDPSIVFGVDTPGGGL